MSRRLPPKIHGWLIRTTRIHAHLCYIVRAFGSPASTAPGDTVEARAARRDKTLLLDCWTHGIAELDQLRTELLADMEPTATTHAPGSAAKIAELQRRVAANASLFADGDRPL